MEGYRIFKKDRQRRLGDDVALSVNDQMKGMKLSLGLKGQMRAHSSALRDEQGQVTL